ncbi:MAG: outer membrane beta-barrel protein [Pseudomonadota bacterium]
MRIHLPILAVSLMALPLPTHAQQTSGFYLEGQGGVNWVDDYEILEDLPPLFVLSPVNSDTGWAASGQVGYGFGNGLIIEGEVTYRDNSGDFTQTFAGAGSETLDTAFDSWAFMGNVLYEFNNIAGVHPYLGAGIGAAHVTLDIDVPGVETYSASDTVFAAQAIAGLRIPFSDRLSGVIDYRYFSAFDTSFADIDPEIINDDYSSHTVMAGLRYTFAPPTAPPPVPVIAPSEPVMQSSFIVFFDWDRADLSPAANMVLDDAVVVANETGWATVLLDGYTDLSGSPAYNLGLSERRANSVADGLIARGIAPDEIVIRAFGEENPLVPTPDGVREPQNRRVEIVFS